MTIKTDVQGELIYLTMVLYLLAFVLLAAQRRRAGRAVGFAGFLVALASVVFRWWSVGHVPLRDLFEVFLMLGALTVPLSILCDRVLNAGDRKWDLLIGAVVLFPAGFVFSGAPRLLPPALQSPLFAPHVLAYTAAYVLMAKATVLAVAQFGAREPSAAAERADAAYRIASLGFVMLSAGLIIGAWWGKLAWGDYWNWDPKEMWSLATWLIYLAYFHLRAIPGRRYSRAGPVFLVGGMIAIVITLLVVSLARIFSSMHSYAG